jgi:glycosyltransferase involved in cell wall biosynthesis
VLLSGVVLAQPPSGVRRHNVELLPRVARRLAERGGALVVLGGREPLDLPASVDVLPSDVPGRPAYARFAREGAELRRRLAAAAARGAPFDLVHTAHLPAPRGLGVPYTFTLHHLKTADQRFEPAWRRLLGTAAAARAVRGAALTIVVSAAVGREVRERFGVPPNALQVVPNAADHLPVLPRAAGPDAPLLHVGQITGRKNLELLLRALAAAPDLPRLVLAGHAGARERERLLRRAEELGVGARIELAGAVGDDELARLYAAAACVVFPSRCEGFGIPALEAQRAGAPLAISRIPALSEVSGADVPSFPPDDPTACVAAIRAALATPADELRRHAEAARRFAWDRSADLWVEAWCRAAVR